MAFAVRTPDEATPKPFEAPVSVTKRVPVAAESGDAGGRAAGGAIDGRGT